MYVVRSVGPEPAGKPSQNSCTPEFPALFMDELLKIMSLVVFLSNPRAQVPTTRHTPSGFLPDRILDKDRRVVF
jgi:hypothetical protein